jgi:hypothetical protein
MEPTYLSWSQSGFYQESIRSLPGVHTLYQESIRSPPGVHQEYQDFIRTPDGLHQDAWGSVTYSILLIIFALKLIEDRAFLFRANFPNENLDVVQKMQLLFHFGDKLPHVRLICLAKINQNLQWRLNGENLIQSSSGIPGDCTNHHLRAPAEGH